jgi:uncharacterized membrane protein YfcA
MLASVSISQGLMMLGVGAAAGILGGALGVGGGILMIPAMVILLGQAYGQNSIHLYKLAAITTSLVLTVPAVIRHVRAGAIVSAMLPGILPAAALGVVGGVLLAGTFVGEHAATLRRIFGGFLELVVLSNLYQAYRTAQGGIALGGSCPMPNRRVRIGLIVGLPAGFIAGLLGVGGGVWAVPAQRQVLGVQIRNAIANSAAMIICVAVVTSVALSVQIASWPADNPSPLAGYWLAIWLSPGALIGGWIGGGLTHRLPVGYLRWGFQLLLAVTGLRLMLA